MKSLLSIIYMLLSFLFVTWLIATTGNYWWIVLLVFLLAGHPIVMEDKRDHKPSKGD